MSVWKILIAVDDSQYAAAALSHGVALAAALHAEVALAHAVDVRAAIVPDAGMASEEILKGLREAGRAILDRAAASVGQGLKPAATFLLEGVVPDELVAAAMTWGATHMVVGTHGRTGLSRLLMGSTAEQVIRHSKVPVVVVPRVS